jgi:cytochrome P450
MAKDFLGKDKYVPEDMPLIGKTRFTDLQIMVSDPEVIRDLMTTKNKAIDKDGRTAIGARNFFGDSFLFSKADANWSRKRKGSAHAFYKDRLNLMMSIL